MDKDKDIDILALEYNLSLTAQERIEQHQAALETVLELKIAHQKIYEEPQQATDNSN